ncbi:MAG: O-antigen ligase family protein [Elusimicrobiota bacterium]
MLAGLVGLIVAAGLLLRGALDSWVQATLLLAFLTGGAAWLCAQIMRGWIPLSENNLILWILALVALAAASMELSLIHVYSRRAWAVSTMGLMLFPVVSVIDNEGREKIKRVARMVAWILVLVALYQRFHGQARPPASFFSQNVFAGAILLLLPIAIRAGDGFLAAGLMVCLWWTHSIGAWLGLAVALLLHRRAAGAAAFWWGAVAGFVGLVSFYSKLQSPEVMHRIEWWRAAWSMAAGDPWLGLGPGAFAHAFAAHVPARPDLSTLHAYQYVLETAAERGWVYLALWSCGLAALFVHSPAEKRFGPIAILIQGLADYALSVPGIFWFFCVSAAFSIPESGRVLNIPFRYRLFSCVLTLIVAGAAGRCVWHEWTAERLRTRSVELIRGDDLQGADALLARSEAIAPHPEAARLRADVAVAVAGSNPSRESLALAAEHMKRASSLDPYRVSYRIALDALARDSAPPGAPGHEK